MSYENEKKKPTHYPNCHQIVKLMSYEIEKKPTHYPNCHVDMIIQRKWKQSQPTIQLVMLI